MLPTPRPPRVTPPSSAAPSLHPQPLATPNLAFHPYTFVILEYYINVTIQYMTSQDWIFSLSIILLEYI